MSLLFTLICLSSFTLLGFSLIKSLLSTRYFVNGPFKSYLLFVNSSFLLIIIPYFIWTFNKVLITEALITDWFIASLMIIPSIVFFIASNKLRDLSKVLGFKGGTSKKKRSK